MNSADLREKAHKLGVLVAGQKRSDGEHGWTGDFQLDDFEMYEKILEKEKHVRESRMWIVALVSSIASAISAFAALVAAWIAWMALNPPS